MKEYYYIKSGGWEAVTKTILAYICLHQSLPLRYDWSWKFLCLGLHPTCRSCLFSLQLAATFFCMEGDSKIFVDRRYLYSCMRVYLSRFGPPWPLALKVRLHYTVARVMVHRKLFLSRMAPLGEGGAIYKPPCPIPTIPSATCCLLNRSLKLSLWNFTYTISPRFLLDAATYASCLAGAKSHCDVAHLGPASACT